MSAAYVIIAILIFGVLIAIHEFGHFSVAKLCGVKVNEFAVGMGPAIWKKQKGETLYALRAIPLGGYCAMEGEDGDSEDPRAFTAQPAWKRVLILCAGSFNNFLLGLVVIFCLYLSATAFVAPTIASFVEGCPYEGADGLKVDVAVNEAEMTLTKVDNGLSLAKMYLCQLCGMDLESDISLADEDMMPELTYAELSEELEKDFSSRPELSMLSNSIDLAKEKTKLARAGYLPQLALTGGAVFSNPSIYNGFERKFKGALTVGVLLRVPVLDWGETAYKIRASKNSTRLAELTYNEAEEMISLQVSQCSFKLKEAHKHLATALGNIKSAEENLRCADLGFKEGVISTTDVMAAQTAWMKAQTEKIDAEIDVKTAEVAMKKATGKL